MMSNDVSFVILMLKYLISDLVIGPSFTYRVSGHLSGGFRENCVNVLCREREDPKSIAAPLSACLFPPNAECMKSLVLQALYMYWY